MVVSDCNGNDFDGEAFSGLIIAVILAGLFFFGSTDIQNLSAEPTDT